MRKALLKKQLYELNRNFFIDRRTGKARKRSSVVLSIVLYALLVLVVLGGMFTLMALGICEAMFAANMGWMYFLLFGGIALMLGVFGSVFNTYASLYDAKDNDFLLSMPIPVREIMIARLAGVYLMGLMFSGIVMLPGVVVFYVLIPQTALSVIGALLLLFLISVFVLVLSCALGWVVAKISAKLKNKSFITVAVSVIFFAAYFYVCNQAQDLIESLIANVAEIGAKIEGAAVPLYMLGRVGEGDPLSMLVWTLVIGGLFVLTCLLISRSFLKLVTTKAGSAPVKVRGGEIRPRTPSAALRMREFKRFTSSPAYMLNCGMATLFLPVAAIALLIKGGDLLSVFDAIGLGGGELTILLSAAICLLASMNDTTAASVSLEGKNLWVVQSLPVDAWKALCAKLSVQLLLTGIPALFCAVCGLILLRPGIPEGILLLILVSAAVFLLAGAGLFLDLRRPNLTWTSEIGPIKQSANILIMLLLGWGYAALIGAGGFFLSSVTGAVPALALLAVLTLALCLLLYGWLKKKGARIFATL